MSNAVSVFPRALPTLSLLLSLAVTFVAAGHDTFLLPNNFAPTPNTPLALDLTSGMAFPKLEVAIKPERVERARFRLGGTTTELTPAVSPQSMRFDTSVVAAGIATIGVSLKPRTLELDRAKIGHYLDEISATPEIRRRAKANPRFRESYVKHSKTFVEATADPADRSWEQPLGLGLEIVPERNPLTLEVGDELPMRVLKGGQPLSGLALCLVAEGQTRGITKRTDAQGRATFKIRQKGLFLLRGTELRPASGELEWESDFTTLTLRVK